MLIHILLDLGQVATHDLYELGREMLRIQSVDTTQDKIVHGGTHVVLDLHHFALLSIGSVRLATAENRKERLPTKFFGRPENARIGKVDHGVKLLQIILHGCSGQQDTSFDGKRVECPRRLVITVLESMSFVTDQEIAAIGVFGESTHVRSDAFVTGNQHVEHFGAHKNVNILLNRLAIGFGQGQSLDYPRSEPLDEFVFPILDETAGTNDNDAFTGRVLAGGNARFEKAEDEADRL
jgi:hypothetical protein